MAIIHLNTTCCCHVQIMHSSLTALQKALKGLVVLSAELEDMGNAMFDQRVPSIWTDAAYPSLKPLNPWFHDLLQRLEFMAAWEEKGGPSVYWVSGKHHTITYWRFIYFILMVLSPLILS